MIPSYFIIEILAILALLLVYAMQQRVNLLQLHHSYPSYFQCIIIAILNHIYSCETGMYDI